MLGSAICQYLGSQGTHLVLLGRNLEKLDKLSSELEAKGIVHLALATDVCSEEDCAKAALLVKGRFKKLDVLIQMAGGNKEGAILRENKSLESISIPDLREVMELNYMGSIIPLKHFLPLLCQSEMPNLIQVSSVAAQKPLSMVMAYASAKAAIENTTKWLALELAKKHHPKFRANAIAPGFILSEQNRNLLLKEDGSLSERSKAILAHTPLARFGTPDDLFGAFQWLCSDASAFVSGSVVYVDGGFSAHPGV